MTPDLPFWTLDGPAHDPLLVVRAGARIDADLAPMPVDTALGWLSRWLLDAQARRVLADIHATLFGALSLTSWGDGDLHRPLHRALTAAIELGDLLVLERRRAGSAVTPPVRPSEPPPSNRPPIKPGLRTFVEIELLDEAGQRFPARLRVTLPDGSGQQPTFNGFIRFDGLDPGT